MIESEHVVEDLAFLMKALADEYRLKLLEMLPTPAAEKYLSVGGLARALGISQPSVSHHLNILKMVRLVRCEKRDGCSYYMKNIDRLQLGLDRLEQLVRE